MCSGVFSFDNSSRPVGFLCHEQATHHGWRGGLWDFDPGESDSTGWWREETLKMLFFFGRVMISRVRACLGAVASIALPDAPINHHCSIALAKRGAKFTHENVG